MIIVRLTGGLGNQMFQYALGRRLSLDRKTGMKFDLVQMNHRIKKFSYVFREFDLPIFDLKFKTTLLSKAPRFLQDLIFIGQTFVNRFVRRLYPANFIEEKKLSFDEEILEAPKNAYLLGFWQDERYFKSIEPLIRKEFTTFKNEMTPAAKKMLQSIKSVNAICVNFRRTDYVTAEIGRKFHGAMGSEYYDRAIALMSEKVPKIHFFIFSDDIEWCKENVRLNFPTTFVGHEYAGVKFSDYLRLMIACKHFIIPNSTFAWWAAWLNNEPGKIVIAPKRWFVDTEKKIDIVPDSWIKI